MQKSEALYVRTDIFDHGIFPAPPKLTMMNLIQLFGHLQNAADKTNQITLEKFCQCLQKSFTKISLQDAEIYFLFYMAIEEKQLHFLSLLHADPKTQFVKQNNKQQIKANVTHITLFLYVQMFSTSLRYQFEKQKDFNTSWQRKEGIRANYSHGFSPLKSPRGKVTKQMSGKTSDYQQTVQFIKHNAKTLLKLVSDDIAQENAVLDAQAYNNLAVLIKTEKGDINLSTLAGPFQQSKKVKIAELSKMIKQGVSPDEALDVILLHNLNKSVTLKENRDCFGMEIKIIGCEESVIFIDSCVKFLSISNCQKCTIYVSAVSRVTTIDKCEKTNVTITSNFLRIGNTIDSTINYYGAYQPVLYGDNRSITLGPFNANCIQLIQRMKAAEIEITQEYLDLFSKPIIMSQSADSKYSIQPPSDFEMLALPEKFFPIHHTLANDIKSLNSHDYEYLLTQHQKIIQKSNFMVPVLTPLEYKSVILDRNMKFQDTYSKISNAGLTLGQKKTIQLNLQAYFKEWLISKGHNKGIFDLVKLIDKE